MRCEMCDKEATLKGTVEGSELSLCESCSRYAKNTRLLQRPAPVMKRNKSAAARSFARAPAPAAPEKRIVGDYAERVRKAREKRNWTQKQLAEKLAEKESLLAKVEQDKTVPSFRVAEKLEQTLHITLITEVELPGVAATGKAVALTIGDILKVK